MPDNLNQLGDNITPDHLPNPISSLDAVGKVTTQLFSVSFWIRAAFIIVGAVLLFIGTKALLSGGAPAMPSAPSTGTPAPAPSSAPAKKPFGATMKKDAVKLAVAVPK